MENKNLKMVSIIIVQIFLLTSIQTKISLAYEKQWYLAASLATSTPEGRSGLFLKMHEREIAAMLTEESMQLDYSDMQVFLQTDGSLVCVAGRVAFIFSGTGTEFLSKLPKGVRVDIKQGRGFVCLIDSQAQGMSFKEALGEEVSAREVARPVVEAGSRVESQIAAAEVVGVMPDIGTIEQIAKSLETDRPVLSTLLKTYIQMRFIKEGRVDRSELNSGLFASVFLKIAEIKAEIARLTAGDIATRFPQLRVLQLQQQCTQMLTELRAWEQEIATLSQDLETNEAMRARYSDEAGKIVASRVEMTGITYTADGGKQIVFNVYYKKQGEGERVVGKTCTINLNAAGEVVTSTQNKLSLSKAALIAKFAELASTTVEAQVAKKAEAHVDETVLRDKAETIIRDMKNRIFTKEEKEVDPATVSVENLVLQERNGMVTVSCNVFYGKGTGIGFRIKGKTCTFSISLRDLRYYNGQKVVIQGLRQKEIEDQSLLAEKKLEVRNVQAPKVNAVLSKQDEDVFMAWAQKERAKNPAIDTLLKVYEKMKSAQPQDHDANQTFFIDFYNNFAAAQQAIRASTDPNMLQQAEIFLNEVKEFVENEYKEYFEAERRRIEEERRVQTENREYSLARIEAMTQTKVGKDAAWCKVALGEVEVLLLTLDKKEGSDAIRKKILELKWALIKQMNVQSGFVYSVKEFIKNILSNIVSIFAGSPQERDLKAIAEQVQVKLEGDFKTYKEFALKNKELLNQIHILLKQERMPNESIQRLIAQLEEAIASLEIMQGENVGELRIALKSALETMRDSNVFVLQDRLVAEQLEMFSSWKKALDEKLKAKQITQEVYQKEIERLKKAMQSSPRLESKMGSVLAGTAAVAERAPAVAATATAGVVAQTRAAEREVFVAPTIYDVTLDPTEIVKNMEQKIIEEIENTELVRQVKDIEIEKFKKFLSEFEQKLREYQIAGNYTGIMELFSSAEDNVKGMIRFDVNFRRKHLEVLRDMLVATEFLYRMNAYNQAKTGSEQQGRVLQDLALDMINKISEMPFFDTSYGVNNFQSMFAVSMGENEQSSMVLRDISRIAISLISQGQMPQDLFKRNNLFWVALAMLEKEDDVEKRKQGYRVLKRVQDEENLEKVKGLSYRMPGVLREAFFKKTSDGVFMGSEDAMLRGADQVVSQEQEDRLLEYAIQKKIRADRRVTEEQEGYDLGNFDAANQFVSIVRSEQVPEVTTFIAEATGQKVVFKKIVFDSEISSVGGCKKIRLSIEYQTADGKIKQKEFMFFIGSIEDVSSLRQSGEYGMDVQGRRVSDIMGTKEYSFIAFEMGDTDFVRKIRETEQAVKTQIGDGQRLKQETFQTLKEKQSALNYRIISKEIRFMQEVYKKQLEAGTLKVQDLIQMLKDIAKRKEELKKYDAAEFREDRDFLSDRFKEIEIMIMQALPNASEISTTEQAREIFIEINRLREDRGSVPQIVSKLREIDIRIRQLVLAKQNITEQEIQDIFKMLERYNPEKFNADISSLMLSIAGLKTVPEAAVAEEEEEDLYPIAQISDTEREDVVDLFDINMALGSIRYSIEQLTKQGGASEKKKEEIRKKIEDLQKQIGQLSTTLQSIKTQAEEKEQELRSRHIEEGDYLNVVLRDFRSALNDTRIDYVSKMQRYEAGARDQETEQALIENITSFADKTTKINVPQIHTFYKKLIQIYGEIIEHNQAPYLAEHRQDVLTDYFLIINKYMDALESSNLGSNEQAEEIRASLERVIALQEKVKKQLKENAQLVDAMFVDFIVKQKADRFLSNDVINKIREVMLSGTLEKFRDVDVRRYNVVYEKDKKAKRKSVLVVSAANREALEAAKKDFAKKYNKKGIKVDTVGEIQEEYGTFFFVVKIIDKSQAEEVSGPAGLEKFSSNVDQKVLEDMSEAQFLLENIERTIASMPQGVAGEAVSFSPRVIDDLRSMPMAEMAAATFQTGTAGEVVDAAVDQAELAEVALSDRLEELGLDEDQQKKFTDQVKEFFTKAGLPFDLNKIRVMDTEGIRGGAYRKGYLYISKIDLEVMADKLKNGTPQEREGAVLYTAKVLAHEAFHNKFAQEKEARRINDYVKAVYPQYANFDSLSPNLQTKVEEALVVFQELQLQQTLGPAAQESIHAYMRSAYGEGDVADAVVGKKTDNHSRVAYKAGGLLDKLLRYDSTDASTSAYKIKPSDTLAIVLGQPVAERATAAEMLIVQNLQTTAAALVTELPGVTEVQIYVTPELNGIMFEGDRLYISENFYRTFIRASASASSSAAAKETYDILKFLMINMIAQNLAMKAIGQMSVEDQRGLFETLGKGGLQFDKLDKADREKALALAFVAKSVLSGSVEGVDMKKMVSGVKDYLAEPSRENDFGGMLAGNDGDVVETRALQSMYIQGLQEAIDVERQISVADAFNMSLYAEQARSLQDIAQNAGDMSEDLAVSVDTGDEIGTQEGAGKNFDVFVKAALSVLKKFEKKGVLKTKGFDMVLKELFAKAGAQDLTKKLPALILARAIEAFNMEVAKYNETPEGRTKKREKIEFKIASADATGTDGQIIDAIGIAAQLNRELGFQKAEELFDEMLSEDKATLMGMQRVPVLDNLSLMLSVLNESHGEAMLIDALTGLTDPVSARERISKLTDQTARALVVSA